MKTEHLLASQPGTIERAARYLRAGHLVVFPTDTVYGIGANTFNEAALEALYRVKRRSRTKGIPVLLADGDDLPKVVRSVPPGVYTLIERFWPGPLTLVLPRRVDLPPNLSPNENVAVRIPDEEIARALIRTAGGAIATSSANQSGEAPARDARAALAVLSGVVAAVVDGGPAAHGTPSTIVDCTRVPFRILRAGPLSAETLSL
jgi:L-threonylcarbamoyladenylate synthase